MDASGPVSWLSTMLSLAELPMYAVLEHTSVWITPGLMLSYATVDNMNALIRITKA